MNYIKTAILSLALTFAGAAGVQAQNKNQTSNDKTRGIVTQQPGTQVQQVELKDYQQTAEYQNELSVINAKYDAASKKQDAHGTDSQINRGVNAGKSIGRTLGNKREKGFQKAVDILGTGAKAGSGINKTIYDKRYRNATIQAQYERAVDKLNLKYERSIVKEQKAQDKADGTLAREQQINKMYKKYLSDEAKKGNLGKTKDAWMKEKGYSSIDAEKVKPMTIKGFTFLPKSTLA